MTKPPKSPKPSISDEEKKEFRKAVTKVKPLEPQRKHYPESEKKPLRRRSQESKHETTPVELSDDVAVTKVYFDTILSFSRSGVSQRQIRNLRRGAIQIDATLDLHQSNIDTARQQFWDFIHDVTEQGLKTILVIHGKGQRQAGSYAILKSHVNHWLQQMPQVLAYQSADSKHGGLGATYVLLKTQR